MPQRLRTLDHGTALEAADQEEGNGRVRARCLAVRLAPGGKLWLSRLNQAEFLDVAWQEDNNTRYLTASLPRRTLSRVAERILSEFGSFEKLVGTAPIPGQLSPEWFQKCADLAREFDWEKWTKPWLVPAKPSERRGSPETTLYVCEGAHRTIVVAVGLLDGSIDWKPLVAIEAEERLAECC